MNATKRGIVLWMLAVATLGLAAGGCWNPFRPLVSNQPGVIQSAPVPDSPRHALDLFQWCWANRDYNLYREIFSADYRFEFAATDSAGNAYRNTPWTRDDELTSAKNLFQSGTASEPQASQITLTFDGSLRAVPDDRGDTTFTWPTHQMILVNNLTLIVTKTDGTAYRVTGGAKFYFVSGDSADIPTDLGFKHDPNRWYIERWVDLTNGSPGTRVTPLPPDAAVPSRPDLYFESTTWGRLKTEYLPRIQ